MQAWPRRLSMYVYCVYVNLGQGGRSTYQSLAYRLLGKLGKKARQGSPCTLILAALVPSLTSKQIANRIHNANTEGTITLIG